jgi:uncharacterized C2H2 Zn-finger protein
MPEEPCSTCDGDGWAKLFEPKPGEQQARCPECGAIWTCEVVHQEAFARIHAQHHNWN